MGDGSVARLHACVPVPGVRAFLTLRAVLSGASSGKRRSHISSSTLISTRLALLLDCVPLMV